MVTAAMKTRDVPSTMTQISRFLRNLIRKYFFFSSSLGLELAQDHPNHIIGPAGVLGAAVRPWVFHRKPLPTTEKFFHLRAINYSLLAFLSKEILGQSRQLLPLPSRQLQLYLSI
jgi:hypothetical protein